MSWAARTAATVAFCVWGVALHGCSLLPRQEEPEAPETAKAAASYRVTMMEAQRDAVTGDLVYVFCQGEACRMHTPKTAPRRETIRDLAPRSRQESSEPLAGRADGQRAASSQRVLVQIAFAYDKHVLDARAKQALTDALPAMKTAKSLKVVGLADTYDRDAYNLALAARRAAAVATWLEERLEGKVAVLKEAGLVRVGKDGTYPKGELFKGRRVDLAVIAVEVD